MYSRWYSAAVVVLWLSAMSWLVIEKVLPTMMVGEPPSYRTILQSRSREPPVAWKMTFDGRELGWALCSTLRKPDNLTEIHSQVHFDQLPLRQMTPGWLRLLLRSVEKPAARLQMDVRSTLTIDPLGRLTDFDSTVWFAPYDDAIKLKGTVDGKLLRLEVSSGDFSYSTEADIPQNALVGDALSPQTQLPGLREGQTWSVPVYSPLRPPNNPLEILQATVQRCEPIIWNKRTEQTWLVVYRRDSGFGLGSDKTPQGRLWVRRDGTVLKQQMSIFNSIMIFTRLPDDQAAAMEAKYSRKPRPVVAPERP